MRLFLTTLLLLTILISTGCSPKRAGSDTLKVGLPDWLGYQPLVWAEKRYIRPGTVNFYEMPSNPESVRLFNNHIIDITCVTVDDAIRLAQYNDDLVIIAILDISHGGDSVLAQPGITSIEQIKGKRIGFEKEGAGAYMFNRLLELTKLTSRDVTPVYVHFYNHKKALESDKVDVIITFEPIASELIESGASKIFDSTQIPNEIVDILITRESVIRDHSEQIRNILDGWYRATKDLKTQGSVAQQYLQSYLGLESQTLVNGFGNIYFPDVHAAKKMLLSQNFSDVIARVNHNLLQDNDINHSIAAGSLVKREFLELLY